MPHYWGILVPNRQISYHYSWHGLPFKKTTWGRSGCLTSRVGYYKATNHFAANRMLRPLLHWVVKRAMRRSGAGRGAQNVEVI